jgi:transposase
MTRTMLNDSTLVKVRNYSAIFDIYLKRNLRNFIEAILYRIRTGCPWRIYHQILVIQIRYSKNIVDGLKHNKLMKIFKLISKHTDKEWIFIDGSHIRAHQHSAGLKDQGISKSIGGNSSKIHLAVDSMAIQLRL